MWPISYESELDVKEFVAKEVRGTEYELYGVMEYIPDLKHYVAYCRPLQEQGQKCYNGNLWFEFNDRSVNQCTNETALQAECAFMLWYRQKEARYIGLPKQSPDKHDPIACAMKQCWNKVDASLEAMVAAGDVSRRKEVLHALALCAPDCRREAHAVGVQCRIVT